MGSPLLAVAERELNHGGNPAAASQEAEIYATKHFVLIYNDNC